MNVALRFATLAVLLLGSGWSSAQTPDVKQKLAGFDQTVNQLLKDWNVPGCGVAVVVKNKLVFAQGYGFRNLEKKQPVTASTLFPIASNTKLFTATAVGLLVEEGKLDWDQPVKNTCPRFSSTTTS